MNKGSNIEISTKFILLTIGGFVSITILVYFLNVVDNNKRVEQFKNIYNSVLNSEFLNDFAELSSVFDANDSISVKDLKQKLKVFKADFSQINQVDLYIQKGEIYYNITDYYTNKTKLYRVEKYLPSSIERQINYLSAHNEVVVDSLLELIPASSWITTVFKIDEGVYLTISYKRD